MVGIALSNTPIFRALDGYQKIVRLKVRLKKSSRVGVLLDVRVALWVWDFVHWMQYAKK